MVSKVRAQKPQKLYKRSCGSRTERRIAQSIITLQPSHLCLSSSIFNSFNLRHLRRTYSLDFPFHPQQQTSRYAYAGNAGQTSECSTLHPFFNLSTTNTAN